MKKILIVLLFIIFPMMVFALPQGDVDGNGKVGSSDYVLVRKHILKQSTLTGDKLSRADVNGDKKVTSLDFVAIRKIILGGGSTPTATPKPTTTPQVKPFVISSNEEYIVGNVNVLDYGADPNGKKDSTEAFKKAMDEANNCINGKCGNNSGGVIYVPKGIYKITSSLILPEHVALVGELKEGTADGTVLMIDFGKGSTDNNNSAIKMGRQSLIKNIAFWYPNQVLSNSGVAVEYPPTILQKGVEGLTIENVTFVNSYIAMDLATHHFNNALQFIKNVYGTPLHTGLINDTNLDTLKVENLHFGSKYWLNSGFKNTPSSGVLSKALMNSSIKPSGFILERVDWYFLSNITIEGYYHGMLLRNSSRDATNGSGEGQIFDVSLNDCKYPIYISQSQHMAITNASLKSNGGNAIYIANGANTDIAINYSNLTTTGSEAIYTANSKSMTITNSTIKGKITRTNKDAKIAFVTDKLSNTGFESYNYDSNNRKPEKSDYNKRVTTKTAMNLVVVKANNNEDITSKINSAVNSLSKGIVYIPAGTYRISGKITVKAGVEIQGSIPWTHNNGGATLLANDNAYFSLSKNSGVNGITIVYGYPNNPDSVPDSQKRYVIQGTGDNIYVMNTAINNAWKGVHLNNSSNHFISHIWGSFLNNGIYVDGGSKNGIIRDCHFTTNVLSRSDVEGFKKSYKYTLEHEVAYSIGNTTNEVLLSSFVWGNNIGYQISNATNFTIIGGGCDMGNHGTTINGNVSGQLINMLLVTKPTNSFTTSDIPVTINVDPTKNSYVESNHKGLVNFINPIFWGNNKASVISAKGEGDFHINGGIIDNSGSPVINDGVSALSMFGTIINQKGSVEIQHSSGSKAANYTCPICTDGTCNVTNTSGITYGLNLKCIS